MGMQDESGIRAGDADRTRVVELLQGHYAAGRLTVSELEERTRQAYASRTLGDLAALLGDLPPAPDPAPAPAAQGAPRGGFAWAANSPFPHRLAGYGLTMAMLVAIWAFTGRGYFSPIWPMIGWGLALGRRHLHGDSPRARVRASRF
jgi:hypothetical protein